MNAERAGLKEALEAVLCVRVFKRVSGFTNFYAWVHNHL